MDKYPKEICACVLLLDNKIINWKISNHKIWPMDLCSRVRIINKPDFDMKRLSHFSNNYVAKDVAMNNRIFNEDVPKWLMNWAIHEDFHGFVPYDKTKRMDEEHPIKCVVCKQFKTLREFALVEKPNYGTFTCTSCKNNITFFKRQKEKNKNELQKACLQNQILYLKQKMLLENPLLGFDALSEMVENDKQIIILKIRIEELKG